MNKKKIKKVIKVIIIIIICFNGLVYFGWMYNVYKDATDGVIEITFDEEVEILEQEYRLDFSETGVEQGCYNDNGLVICVGAFFDKERMLEVFEFKNNEIYEEALEHCDSGGVKYKACNGVIRDAYVMSTSDELVSETSYRVYIYMCEDLYFMELQKDEVELAETLEIFD